MQIAHWFRLWTLDFGSASPDTSGMIRSPRLRFSLRTLLVLLTIVCVVLGVIVSRAERQRRAVAAIVKAGGEVAYDYEIYPEMDEGGDRVDLPGPDWLCRLLGVDYFGTVIWAHLTPTPTPLPPDCAPDEVAVHLGRLPGLETVLLSDTSISRKGLAELSGLKKLRELGLDGSQVTDADLAPLAALTSLEELRLDGTKVTGSGMAHLSKLANLRDVSVTGTRVDDAGLAHLRGLTSLNYLSLTGTQVTDAGLPHLASLPKLHSLDLAATPVTATDLAPLHNLTNLRWLYLDAEQRARPGAARLQQALPSCSITP